VSLRALELLSQRRAVEKTTASGIEFDQHIGGASRDVNVQNPVVTTFSKEVFPFDISGIETEVFGLSRSGSGAVQHNTLMIGYLENFEPGALLCVPL
jgi:hypothetical protein